MLHNSIKARVEHWIWGSIIIAFKLSVGLLILLFVIGPTQLAVAAPTQLTQAQAGQQVAQHRRQQTKSLRAACFASTDTTGLTQCKRLIGQYQADSEAWNQLGRIYYDSGNYEEAYLSFKYATHLRRDYSVAWANTCAALSQLKSYSQALNACNQSLAVSSASKSSIDDQILAWNNKAIVLYFLGRYQESIEALDTVLELSPQDSQAAINRTIVSVVLHALNQADDLTTERFSG